MNKMGLVDFWCYENEVFEFENGHMLLRGSNGSGKTSILSAIDTIKAFLSFPTRKNVDSEEDFVAVQIVLEDGSLYNGYMLKADIEPDGISATLIVGITIIVAVATIILSLLFIKKKKKKSGSKD